MGLFVDKKQKVVIQKTQWSAQEVEVKLQIDDTGLENDYLFELKNDKWSLMEILDYSD